jgi:hypothetical protein
MPGKLQYVQVALVAGAVALAVLGKEGWGWMLFVLLLTFLMMEESETGEPSVSHIWDDDDSDEDYWRGYVAENLTDYLEDQHA